MSEGVKKPLYQLVQQDSRNAARVGNMIGGKVGQTIENEADYNTKNPGHAITKAAEYAATYYLGSLLDAGGAAADAGAASTDAAESGGTLALNQAGTAVTPYVQQAMAGGASASPGLLSQGAYRAFLPGVNGEQADMLASQTGDFGPAGLKMTAQAANTAQGLNPAQQALGNFFGGASDKTKLLAMKMGMSELQPPPQPQMPPPQRPSGYGQPVQPLPLPYGGQAGQPAMSGLQPLPTYAELLRRRQLMGY